MTNPLQQAAVELRAGRKESARALLIDFVRQNPKSEDGWMMLSLTLADPRQQKDCYKRVLLINPNNTEAREKLKALVRPPPPDAPPPRKAKAFRTGTLEELELPTSPTAAENPTPLTPTPPPASMDELEALFGRQEPTATGPQPEPASPDISATPGGSLEQEWRPDQDLQGPTWASHPEATPERTTGWEKYEGADWALTVNRLVIAPRRSSGSTLNRLIILAAGIALLVIVVGVTLTYYRIYGANTAAANATATARMIAALATMPFPTLPPTWTSTPTPTVTPTPTITPTPTRTPVPTPFPPAADVLTTMDTLQLQVADLRGLAVRGEIQKYVIDRKHVRASLEELYLNYGGSREAVADEARVLSAIGLIKPTFDLFTYTLNGISDGIGGFYTPWTKQLYVIGEEFTGVEKWVYSHEYDHALTDAHFAIADMGVFPICIGDEQRCDAIRALVEGDATLLMTQWFRQYASPQDYQDILAYDYDPSNRTLPEQFPPPFASRDAAFPYREGLAFVQYLYEKGNWAEVNKAYQRLPQSTEHILHPQKYVDDEAPLRVDIPSFEGALGAEWRLLRVNSLGEWTTYLMLSYGADLAAQVEPNTGAEAAAGWGGDSYQVYYNDATGRTILAAHWTWDTEEDADEFKEAMLFYQDQRFRGSKLSRADGDCWEANDQTSCIFATGNETLWILAPDQTMLDDVLTRYTNFP